MSFKSFNLSSQLTNALSKLGYIDPSPVQKAVIPKALRGTSLLAQSETGSGKTHAFLIPLIEKIDFNLNRPQAIVISPTRELARQTYEFAFEFTRFFPKFKVRLYTSESDVSDNVEGKSVPPQLIIGTPGRLKDLLITKHIFFLGNLKRAVLDEADMLLDMGFFGDIEEIFANLDEPQTMVFSATLKQNLKDELLKFVRSDFEFENDNIQTASSVKHHLIDIKHIGESAALLSFLKIRKPYLAIIFASTVEKVNTINKSLKENGFETIYFTGSLDDRSRKKALRQIKSNTCSIIVASDILSRGLDIPDVSDVISIDLPNDLEFYHHRAGRTGRFGKAGDSWVFFNADTVSGPIALQKEGVKFDYFSLKGDELKKETLGPSEKRKMTKKKELPEAEMKDIKIAKALSRTKGVEPGYKKKKKEAIDKVKRKYRRMAIRNSVRKQLDKSFRINDDED